jgi:hypothetical protein
MSAPAPIKFVVRVALTAGVMVLAGATLGFLIDFYAWLIQGKSNLVGFLTALTALIGGIAAGSYFSLRYIAPGSILCPILAAAILGALPVGVSVSGDAFWIRVGIIAIAVALAAIAAVVSRNRLEAAGVLRR